MKVRELIELLKKCDQEASVRYKIDGEDYSFNELNIEETTNGILYIECESD